MRKISLTLILIFISLLSFGQKKNITVTKKDGTILNIKRYSSKVKYLKLIFDNGNKQEMPYNQLDKIEYEYEYKKEIKNVTVQFIRISKRNGSLMDLVLAGKCSVYKNLVASGAGGSVTTYYVKKENEPIATKLGSNSFVDLGSYKKTALKYFNDCPKVINRINKRFKRKKIKELVEFYNNNCL